MPELPTTNNAQSALKLLQRSTRDVAAAGLEVMLSQHGSPTTRLANLARTGLRAGGSVAAVLERVVLGSRSRIVSQTGEFIELRMTRLLNSMQIPTFKDIQQLGARVEELSRQVETLEARNALRGGNRRSSRKPDSKPRTKAGTGKAAATGKALR